MKATKVSATLLLMGYILLLAMELKKVSSLVMGHISLEATQVNAVLKMGCSLAMKKGSASSVC